MTILAVWPELFLRGASERKTDCAYCRVRRVETSGFASNTVSAKKSFH
jgi:hypothetical protein